MRTHIIAIAILMAVLLPMQASAALTPNAPDLSASLLYYEPVPAQPGSLMDVYILVSNAGAGTKATQVEFVDNGPFKLDASDERTKTIPSIPSQESFLVKYKVRVSNDATPGTNNIKILFGEQTNRQQALLAIDVFSSSTSLSVDDLHITPQLVSPGEAATVTFTLRNRGGITISDGTARLDLSSIDMIPISGTNKQRFTQISPEDSKEVSFQLVASPDLAPGAYQVPLLLNYTDQRGNGYSATEIVGIRVGADPSMSVLIDDNPLSQQSPSGEITFRVTNQGIGEVKFTRIVLHDDPSYSLLSGGSERYVGNIDSDDYKTDRFSIRAEEDHVQIPVTLVFSDTWNQQHTLDTTLSFDLPAGASGGLSGTMIVVIVIVLAALGIWLWRRRKPTRKR